MSEYLNLILGIIGVISFMVSVIYKFSTQSNKITENESKIKELDIAIKEFQKKNDDNLLKIQSKQSASNISLIEMKKDLEYLKTELTTISNNIIKLLEKNDDRLSTLEKCHIKNHPKDNV